MPDVSLIGTTWMGEFAKLGGLEPTPDSIDPAQFFEGAWETTDGRRRQLRRAVVRRDPARLLPHRPRRGRAASTRRPPNWDELTAARPGRRSTPAPSTASACSPAAPVRGRRSCRSSGRPVARSSTTRATFTLDSDACVEALTYYDSFFEEGLTPPAVSRRAGRGAVRQRRRRLVHQRAVDDRRRHRRRRRPGDVDRRPPAEGGDGHVVRRRRQPRRLRRSRTTSRRRGRSSST